jgi:hypothetical protein
MALTYSRNARLVITDDGTTHQSVDILDGFSFSQATGTQAITLNEAGNNPKRGQNIINSSLEAVDWSFTSYMRPVNASEVDTAVEAVLWNALVTDSKLSASTAVVEGASSLEIDFTKSNKNKLGSLTGYFAFSNATGAADGLGDNEDATVVYKLTGMAVNSASIDFDIDGIAQIAWSGSALALDSTAAIVTAYNALTKTAIPADAEFIMNRVSTCTVESNVTGSTAGGALALTGGNITIDNGTTTITPEVLGVVNKPIHHQTGVRAITGNTTCYLDTAGKEIYEEILADMNTGDPLLTNSYKVIVNIGGTNTPFVSFTMPTCHLELPAIDVAEVMGVTINFTALESSLGSSNDELAVSYNPTQ